MPPVVDLVALYGVPALAGAITAGVLLGPASERPAVGARVHGFVVEGAERCALRVHTRQHLRGAYADFAAPVEVHIEAAGALLGTAEARAEPIAEVVVPLAKPVAESLDVLVSMGGVSLAEVTLRAAAPLVAEPIPMQRRTQGDATLTLGLRRGFAVPELPEMLEVRVDVAESGEPPVLTASAVGADLGDVPAPARACEDARCRYSWALALTAHAPAVVLDVAITRGDAAIGAWSGPLPIVPGSLWLDPATDETLRLRSAVPRDEAFVSLVSRRGRFFGAHVPMIADEMGFSAGSVPAPPLPDEPVVAWVSGYPDEPESASAPWPLGDATFARGRAVLLADGLPAAIAKEEERRRSARRPAYALIVAAGIFELIYLLWRARRARRTLELHLARQSEGGGDATLAVQSALPLTALLLLAGALALAFAILAVLSAVV